MTIQATLAFDILIGDAAAADEKKKKEEAEAKQKKEKEKEEEEERDSECCICMDERATMINEICKHTVMCHTCAFAFLARSEKSEQPYLCPVCRAAIGNMYIDTTAIKAKT